MRKSVVIAGSLAVIVVATGAFFFVQGQIGPYDLLKQSRALDATLAKSKALGLPMTKADFLPATPVPDAENAALVVIPAANKLSSEPASGDVLLPGADPKKRAEAIALLRKQQATMNEIKAGLKRPKWYVERDWDLGPHLLFPEFAKLKSAVRLFATESVLLAIQGKDQEALASFRNGRRLANFAGQEPCLIALLVGIACDSLILRAAENLTEVWAKDHAQLDRLATAIEETNFTLDPRPAWGGEFYMALSYSRNFEAYGGLRGFEELSGPPPDEEYEKRILPPDPAKLRREGTPTVMTARAMLNPVAGIWNTVFEKWPTNPPAAGEWGPLLDKAALAVSESGTVSGRLAQVFMPVFAQADRATVKRELWPKLHVALIRVVQHRAKTGSYPKSLKAIGIVIPDTLGEAGAVRYEVQGDRVQIWTLGPEMVDNGGPLQATRPANGKKNIGVVFPSSQRPKSDALRTYDVLPQS